VEALEAQFFRTLNALVEPAVRAGCGSPGVVPTGMIVLETTGARSGEPRRVPLTATILDGCVFLATVRGSQSLWVRNIAVEPRVRYWMAGRPHRGRARIVRPESATGVTEGLPPLARAVADGVLAPAAMFGWTFVIVTPDP